MPAFNSCTKCMTAPTPDCHPDSSAWMPDLTTELCELCSFDLHATWVIAVLDLVTGMPSMGVLQPGIGRRPVVNVCTVCETGQ